MDRLRRDFIAAAVTATAASAPSEPASPANTPVVGPLGGGEHHGEEQDDRGTDRCAGSVRGRAEGCGTRSDIATKHRQRQQRSVSTAKRSRHRTVGARGEQPLAGGCARRTSSGWGPTADLKVLASSRR